MTCGKCGRDNPAHTMFCMGCGGKLELTRAGVESQLKGEIKGEREQRAEDLAVRILLLLLPLAVIAFYFRGAEPVLPAFEEAPAIEGGVAPVVVDRQLDVESAEIPFVTHRVGRRSAFVSRRHRTLLAAHHGGGPETERAVEKALGWLASAQQRNGRWTAGELGGEGAHHDVGVTGLALLAFTGAGYTDAATLPEGGENPYRKTVAAGIAYLLGVQANDRAPGGAPNPLGGLFIENPDGPEGTNYMYDQALATAALAEVWGLAPAPGREPLREGALRGARFLLRVQSEAGGWGYQLGTSRSDSSVTCWQIQALKTCLEAGVLAREEAGPAFDRAGRFLVSFTNPTGFVGYTSSTDMSEEGYGTTAAALAVRLLLGIDRASPEAVKFMDEQAAILRQRAPAWDPGKAGLDFYRFYYTSLALFQAGGRAFPEWNAALKPVLLEHQNPDGSWEPVDRWATTKKIGKVYATAMAALCLEVYYRYPAWD